LFFTKKHIFYILVTNKTIALKIINGLFLVYGIFLLRPKPTYSNSKILKKNEGFHFSFLLITKSSRHLYSLILHIWFLWLYSRKISIFSLCNWYKLLVGNLINTKMEPCFSWVALLTQIQFLWTHLNLFLPVLLFLFFLFFTLLWLSKHNEKWKKFPLCIYVCCRSFAVVICFWFCVFFILFFS
jgi:hypothetical protein